MKHSSTKCRSAWGRFLRCTLSRSTFDGARKMSVRSTFTQARTMAPCLLIVGDLNSLVDEKTRIYFLNEVDELALKRWHIDGQLRKSPGRIRSCNIEAIKSFQSQTSLRKPERGRMDCLQLLLEAEAVQKRYGRILRRNMSINRQIDGRL